MNLRSNVVNVECRQEAGASKALSISRTSRVPEHFLTCEHIDGFIVAFQNRLGFTLKPVFNNRSIDLMEKIGRAHV